MKQYTSKNLTYLQEHDVFVSVVNPLVMSKYSDNAVYLYMIKKESEGKPLRVAKIAALNKFLRIYYARVKRVLHEITVVV